MTCDVATHLFSPVGVDLSWVHAHAVPPLCAGALKEQQELLVQLQGLDSCIHLFTNSCI